VEPLGVSWCAERKLGQVLGGVILAHYLEKVIPKVWLGAEEGVLLSSRVIFPAVCLLTCLECNPRGKVLWFDLKCPPKGIC
jgi:hypothetical protein